MSSSSIYRLLPYPVAKPWGGGHLDHFGTNQKTEKIGELVLFSDLPQFPVKLLVDGVEIPLAEFWQRHFSAKASLPFMLKLLSTAEPLSVQNHPSDDDVRALGLDGSGKFEAWTILDADTAARMYLGLKKEHPPETLLNLEALENPLSVFHEFRPRVGDVVTLVPGLVHSTTGRMLFYEIQQVSDHTFRIYDFGRGRALHLEQAIRCLHEQEPVLADWSCDLLTPLFRVSYHKAQHGLIALNSAGGAVLTWFGSEVELSCAGTTFTARWGDSFFMPDASLRAITVKKLAPETNDLPMIDMLFEAHLPQL